jgi:hypothetical protein
VGNVYRPTYTKPLPAGEKVVTRGGKRTDAAGRRRRAPATVTRAARPGIVVQASTYTAQCRDAAGVPGRAATGGKTVEAARAVLAGLEAREERVKAGPFTQTGASVADHAETPVCDQRAAYVAQFSTKRGRGARRRVSSVHIANVDRYIHATCHECGLRRLRDLNREAVESWVSRSLDLPDEAAVDPAGNVVTPRQPSARTINARLVP